LNWAPEQLSKVRREWGNPNVARKNAAKNSKKRKKTIVKNVPKYANCANLKRRKKGKHE
jgi:hypothetical protein